MQLLGLYEESVFIGVHPWLKPKADVTSCLRKIGGRDVALRRPRPVQGRNASARIATLHASRSAQRADPTIPDGGTPAGDIQRKGPRRTGAGQSQTRAGGNKWRAQRLPGTAFDLLAPLGLCVKSFQRFRWRSQFRVASKNITALYETVVV